VVVGPQFPESGELLTRGLVETHVQAEPGLSLTDPAVDDGLAQMDDGHLGEIEIVGLFDVPLDLERGHRKRRGLIDPAPAAGGGALAEGGEAEAIASADGRAAEAREVVVAGAVPDLGRVDAVAGVSGRIGFGQVGHASLQSRRRILGRRLPMAGSGR